ncbi:MAG: divalent-cation tolerance protein CutA [Methanobrevibacter sp.]|jgi:periplasmic divalent cation tolerance protein|nr:divalent-cation tolerance protein CutA [Methanobrevibacter sp.]
MMVLIYITCEDEEESIKIAEILLKERLIACSNIIKDIKSMYWWEESIEVDNESILILKTIENKVEEIIKKVKKIHSYENPSIFALPIKTSDAYFQWIHNEIK